MYIRLIDFKILLENTTMATKEEMIQEMLDMQAKFEIDGFDAENYYTTDEGKAHRQRYQELTNMVRDAASEEAGFWK